MKGWKKVYQANSNQKKTETVILVSDKVEFRLKTFKGTRGTFSIDKRNNLPRCISVLNLCVPMKLLT